MNFFSPVSKITFLPVFCCTELRDLECDVMALRSDVGTRLEVRLGVGTTARDFVGIFVGFFNVSA